MAQPKKTNCDLCGKENIGALKSIPDEHVADRLDICNTCNDKITEKRADAIVALRKNKKVEDTSETPAEGIKVVYDGETEEEIIKKEMNLLEDDK